MRDRGTGQAHGVTALACTNRVKKLPMQKTCWPFVAELLRASASLLIKVGCIVPASHLLYFACCVMAAALCRPSSGSRATI